MLSLPAPDLRALAAGEVVICFAERATVDEGDELSLVAGGTRPPEALKPAYARWADEPAPEGAWTAVAMAVHPASGLDAAQGAARHILADAPVHGDVVVLRVYLPDGEPVLSDAAFSARVRSLEGALR